ncbi:MAG: hypothetical protein V3U16_05540 [Candidatus Neomarinimicrobiota bacterium]
MNNYNNNKVQPDINKFSRQDGFAFTALAVVIAVILGFVGLFLKNHASVNIGTSADLYSSSQSFWSSVSGVDFVLENLDFNAGNTNNTYTFYNSSVNITSDLINLPTDSTYLVTSTGTHGGHIRRLKMVMQPPSPFDNTFFDIDSTGNWDYTTADECSTAGLPGGRYWGSSCATCPGEDYGFQQPVYGILDSTDLPLKDPDDPSLGYICYWLGVKEQNPKWMYFKTIENLFGVTNIEISLWLGAGVDDADPAIWSDFQNGDNFEITANGITLELWDGPPGTGPMSPTIDTSLGDLQPQFQEFTFNLSDILGTIDTLRLGFIGNTNTAVKYSGFSGVNLSYDLNWIIDISSIQEW